VAKAAIDGAKAAIEQAQLNVEFTKVTAPFGGRISRPQADKGSLVRADDTTLTKLVDASQVYVDFSVDERSLRRYLIQARAEGKSGRDKPIKELNIRIKVGLEGDSGFPYSGVLDFVGVEIDRKTGTYPVRGIIENKDGVFLSGFRAQVLFPLGEKRERIMVTGRAIGSDQGKKFVYVVKDDTAKRRDVVLGRLRPDGLRIVSEGLNKDDLVIVNEVQRVRPEMKVVPSVEPMPDAPKKAAN
jgi:RND family efflux transporter MFP subunit